MRGVKLVQKDSTNDWTSVMMRLKYSLIIIEPRRSYTLGLSGRPETILSRILAKIGNERPVCTFILICHLFLHGFLFVWFSDLYEFTIQSQPNKMRQGWFSVGYKFIQWSGNAMRHLLWLAVRQPFIRRCYGYTPEHHGANGTRNNKKLLYVNGSVTILIYI